MESEADANETVYTYAELSQHKDTSSAWLVIHDNVYDVTKFLEEVWQEARLFLTE